MTLTTILGVAMLFVISAGLGYMAVAARPRCPWNMQRDLMDRSDQECPDQPLVTKTTVLYAALNLEELAETFAVVAEVLSAGYEDRQAIAYQEPGGQLDRMLVQKIATLSSTMQFQSTQIRNMLKSTANFHIVPTREQAIDLLDGTTDIAVVNCGLAVASGLPGAEAYQEVYESNRSKANPDTGTIDKTPDGKWIKGAKYREPDLDAILDFQSLQGVSA